MECTLGESCLASLAAVSNKRASVGRVLGMGLAPVVDEVLKLRLLETSSEGVGFDQAPRTLGCDDKESRRALTRAIRDTIAVMVLML